MTVRTRMAPSPTGEYHIGSMRTLLYNYALARHHAGKFVLRIEDTDRERFVEGATQRLMQAIYDYGLCWDEGPDVGGAVGPYIQSERLEIYKKHALQLVESGHAYYCFCSKERLDALRLSQQQKGVAATKYDKKCLSLSKEEVLANLSKNMEHVIRLNVSPNEQICFTDEVLGKITIPSNDVDDQVLLKSDGFPTYHLAVVVDDYLMQISHILRGVEWLPSTPKHVLLYKAFGWELPVYAHVPLLKEQGETKKLSKRHGAVNAQEFLRDGYLPEALLNFLMFLGWNPGTEKEIYTLAEFVADFSIEKIHKTDLVVFDRSKLLWINGYYIRSCSIDELFEKLTAWAQKFDILLTRSQDAIFDKKVLSLVQERMKVLTEYNELVSFFYQNPRVEPNLLITQSGTPERARGILSQFISLYEEIDNSVWNKDNLDKISHDILATKGYKTKEAFMTLRVALTGLTSTPPIFDILDVLGKQTSISRIKKCIEML